MSTRKITTAVLAAAFVASGATAAQATGGESGTKGCATNQTGVSRGYTTGTTEHAPPGAGYGKFYNGTSWRYTAKSATVAPGGAWAVYTSGSLNFAGTYAYCITGTP